MKKRAGRGADGCEGSERGNEWRKRRTEERLEAVKLSPLPSHTLTALTAG